MCHKRTAAGDYCGYCSRSHTTSYGHTKNKFRLARPIGHPRWQKNKKGLPLIYSICYEVKMSTMCGISAI